MLPSIFCVYISHHLLVVDGDDMRTPNPAPDPIYWGKGLVPEERAAIEELMSLPCKVAESGMVVVLFQTFASTESLTGWDVIYFARSSVSGMTNF